MSTEKNSQTSVSNVTIDNIDDFLPMPGAESVVTADDEGNKPGFFAKEGSVNLNFLDEDDNTGDDKEELDADGNKIVKPNAADTQAALAELDADLEGDDDEQGAKAKPGRKKIDKSGLVETFSKLFEEGVLVPFEDEKPLEEYSVKDWKDLIAANFEEKEKALKEQTPKEFFESLPEELQYAAEYVAKGGTDIKGMFRALAQAEEMRDLNPAEPDDQELIVRNYLLTTNFGDNALIEEQVQEWAESGVLGKKAAQFKPKLDAMQEQVIQSKIEQQEKFRQEQLQKKEEYMDNIYNTLKPAELNGVKLDAKRQKFLWEELTSVKYQSMTGRPTNLLGKLLEDHQFSKTPRYDLIAETLWLLSDPDDYKENIRKQAKNEVTQDTVRKLKTEEARKISSAVKEEEEDDKPAQRRIPRPAANIFKR